MRAEARALALVAAGGAAGAGLRALLSAWWPASADSLPTTTLLVNLSGAFLLGLLHGWLDGRAGERPAAPGPAQVGPGLAQDSAPPPQPVAVPSGSTLRLLLGTGLLGGFTTHSTFSLEALRLLEQAPALGGTYLLGSFTGGLLLAAVGLWAGASLVAAVRQGVA